MRNAFIFILTALFSLQGRAQNYVPVAAGSAIKFSIKNFAVNVGGSFTGLKGTIHFNEADQASAMFDVTVDANSVNTGNNGRDNHLKKEEYFYVQKYPAIRFVSKHVITPGEPGLFTMTGIMMIKGVSKEISFPFNVTKQQDGLLFTGTVKLNRRDFKVGGSSLILSDNLTVSLSVFAKK